MELTELELLKKFVSINSIFPNEKELAEFAQRYLEEKGFKTKRQILSENPLRFNVLAEKGEAKKSIMLYGHLDTVPVYGQWTNNPFNLAEKEEELIGLGAFDMKSGCCALIKASEEITPKNYKIKIVLGCDEENISEGGWKLAQSDFIKDVECVFIAEPGTSKQAHKGARMITLGRRGRCDIIIRVYGVSAHGAYELGINAVNESARIIIELEKAELINHPQLGKGTLFAKKIHADPGSLSVPDYCEITMDRHLVPPETTESAVNQIKDMIKRMRREEKLKKETKVEVELKQRKTRFLQPYATDKENKFVKITEKVIKEKFGEIYYNYGLSVADDNIFGSELKLPAITIGSSGGNAHSADEYVNKKSYLELIEIYKEIIKKIDDSE